MTSIRLPALSLHALAALTAAMCLVGLFASPASGAVGAPGVASAIASSAAWTPIGPNSEAGSIAQAPGAPGRAVLVPSYGVGLWATDDSGATWRQLPDPPGVRNVGDANRAIIDPADAQRWWYAGTAAESAESVVLESVDGGRTWTESARFSGELLAFLELDSGTTVVATSTGATTAAIHTRDGSGTWSAHPIDTGATIRTVIAHGDALVLSGHFSAWRLDAPGSDSMPVEIYHVSAAARTAVDEALSAKQSDAGRGGEDVNQIWDVASTASVILVKELGRGIVGSVDSGTSWTDWAVPHEVSAISSNGDALYLVRSEPGPRWADVTTDAGAIFTPLRIPDDGAIEHQFTSWPDGSLTTANPRSGLYRTSDNGKMWNRIGVQGLSGLDLLVHGEQLFAGTEQSLARTPLPSTSPEWGTTGDEARVGTTTPALASAGDADLIWKAVDATFNDLDVYSSANGGKTWDKRTTVFGVAKELMVHPADPDRVILTWQLGTGCGLHITADRGATWTTTRGDCFDSVVGDPRDPDRVWLGGRAGLFRSDDGGKTGVQVTDFPATTVLVDRHRLVIGGDEIYTSDDDGATFTPSSRATTSSANGPRSYTSLVRSGPRIFAGYTTGTNTTESGVLLSADGGSTWADFSTGLQNSEVLSLAVSANGNTLFAGTRNGGVHSTPLPRRIAPTAASDTGHTQAGHALQIDVLSNDDGGDLPLDRSTVLLHTDTDVEWGASLTVQGEGSFEVDPLGGRVTFTPEDSFSGTTSPVTYRVANTDGEVAQAELTVVVESSVDPGEGSGGGEHESGSADAPTDPLATTGADSTALIVAALVLLTAGCAVALYARLRRRTKGAR